jgi:hypothetical protein
MAGPEGFDPSLIETEALLKKMKPRPANLSAARIVYEAGRAVGKEETQALLVSGGFVAASAAPMGMAKWKSWVFPAWAGGATALCLLLYVQFATRGPRSPEPPNFETYSNVRRDASGSVIREDGTTHQSPGLGGLPHDQVTENRLNGRPPVAPNSVDVERQVVSGVGTQKGVTTKAGSDSDNESGSVREGRFIDPPKKREKNLAEYLRDQLPPLESRRNIDPIEIRDGILQPPGKGVALSALGFIKTP